MRAHIVRGPARALTSAAVAGAALLLGGCGLFHHDSKQVCIEPPAVQTARDQGPLRVPPGMRAPDTTSAITIPDLHAKRSPGTGSGACLFEPPVYRPSSAAEVQAPARKVREADPKGTASH